MARLGPTPAALMTLGMALAIPPTMPAAQDSGDHGPHRTGGDAPASQRELVVLAHGMGRTRHSMRPMERALESAGYEVLNYSYPSRRGSVADHGQALARRLCRESAREDVARIHLAGHSLGNIVIRWMIANEPPPKLGRVVMLAPPNRGSRLADLTDSWLGWLSRPLAELTTDPLSTTRTIPTPAGVEIGVIAGSRDFTVRAEETHLEGQTDHVVVPSAHTFIMRRRQVHELTIRFLQTGAFAPPDSALGDGVVEGPP